MAELVAHPLASRFPPLSPSEFEALKESIAAVGLMHPIVINERGEILEGIHRWRACTELGIKPATVQFVLLSGSDGEKPAISEIEYIFAANVHRRHLSDDQRTALSTVFLPEIQAASKLRRIEGCKKGGEVTRQLKLSGGAETDSRQRGDDDGEALATQEPPWKNRDRNLTKNQFKNLAKVGARKATQAIRLFNADPKLLDPVISGEETLLEACRKFDSSGSSGNGRLSHPRSGRRAKAPPRLLSNNELWIRVERWNGFHIGRLLKGINPTQQRDVLLQVANFCYELMDKV